MASILCIEDEPGIRENIIEELRDAGHDTIEAEDGRIGLDLIRRHRPDLVISDITMPNMSGYEVLAELRESEPDLADTPFMFLSALGDRKDVIAGKRLGADDYLVKPVDFENLLATVQVRIDQIERIKKSHDLEVEEYREEILHLLPHELLTPLNHIMGFADMIRGQHFGPVDPQYHDYACEIYEASRHLHTIVRNVMDLAEAVSGRLKPAPIDCDIGLIVEQEISEYTHHAETCGIKLTFTRNHDDMNAYVDPSLLKSAVGALISNAVKFSPRGTDVEIAIATSAVKGVSVTVVDHGPGMRKEDVDAAMRPFYQLDRGLARKHEGLGNGLALIRAIADYTGMDFRIDSQPGKGTRAEISISV